MTETTLSPNQSKQKNQTPATPSFPKNQILYGPPGTGKTYNSILKALEITGLDRDENNNKITDYAKLQEIFNQELKKENGQIKFITFHQSYTYEEFVESIRPSIAAWNGEEQQNSETPSRAIQYIGKDGIFKNICNLARQITPTVSSAASKKIDFAHTRVFKLSLVSPEDPDIYDYCIKNNVIALGWVNAVDCSDCRDTLSTKNKLSSYGPFAYKAIDRFKNWMRTGDIVLISNGNKNIRAIGRITGDYFYNPESEISFNHFRTVEWLYVGENISIFKLYNKNLSQQSVYAFYDKNKEGRPDYNGAINTDLLNSLITGKPVSTNKKQNYVLIIDEINRGTISKIFGELITLIEEDKRQKVHVTLPYSNETFTVPDNLYIIGTMNNSDRSATKLDIALRRRFVFKEMRPDSNLVIPEIANVDFKKIFQNLNKKIAVLLDKDHQIGHSYFMFDKIKTVTDLKQTWFNSIIPLLDEYFYNDWEKLKALIPGFIKKEPILKELEDCTDEEYYYEFITAESMSDADFISALKKGN